MTYSFTISGIYYGDNRVMPDLNNYLSECNRHPRAGAKMKRDYMMIASNHIRRQIGRVSIEKPVIIHYRFYEADRRRDVDNVGSFAQKVIHDALQQCNVLKNDNQRYLHGYTHEFFIDKDNPRIEVEIEEIEDE